MGLVCPRVSATDAGDTLGKSMSESNEKIEFQAEVIRVQTMADGAIRVIMDMSEDSIMQMAQLAECKRWGAVLNVEAVPEG